MINLRSAEELLEEDSASLREQENKIKENLSICITITLIVMLAILITSIKIIIYDKDVYPSVFYTQEEIDARNNVSDEQIIEEEYIFLILGVQHKLTAKNRRIKLDKKKFGGKTQKQN